MLGILKGLKTKYADYPELKEIVNREFKKVELDDGFFAVVTLLNIIEVSKEREVPRSYGKETILANGYKWLTLYPREEKYTVTAIFNERNEVVEFYFDIAKKVKYKAKVPFTKDLFLDVVLTKENDVIFLDEDELDDALNNKVINKTDFELAKKTADKIVNRYHRPDDFERLKQMAERCLEGML